MATQLAQTLSKQGLNILKSLPQCNMAFAYGSAVFKQLNNSSNNMLDIVLVVDDLKSFHEENLRRNRSHYSHCRVFGPKFLTTITDLPAYVYYNTAVRIDDTLLKYGVISKDRLISDLLDWDVLYVAGRLHKPVKFITEIDPEVEKAQEVNLRSALHVAFLTLPETFSLEDLFTRITTLSYDGDFRMIFGEDKNKISNIVKPGMEKFTQLYEPYLNNLTTVEYNATKRQIYQDLSEATRLHHLELLPKTVQHHLMIKWRPGENRHKDVEEILKSIARNPATLSSDVVRQSVRSIVRSSAVKQSVKGLLTSGPFKAVGYVTEKIKKMMRSLQTKPKIS